MLPTDRVQSTGRERLNLVERVQRATDRIPFPQRIVPIIGAVLFLCPVLAPIAVVSKVRTKMASAYVAMLAAWIIYVFALYSADPADRVSGSVRWSLLALPVVMAVAAHLGPMSRWYVPCRTVAVTLLWPVIITAALLKQLPSMHIPQAVGVIFAWLLALIVFGWRAAKGMQDARLAAAQASRTARPPARPPAVPRGGGQPGGTYPGGHSPVQYGAPARGVAQVYADHAARDQQSAPPRPKPQITVEDAMAELDAMVGLGQVKEQVRSIAASIEAARRRAVAGFSTDKPMRHFVFLGPPGTGKTTVARTIGKIFYAFGLLDMPEVVEAQRSDLVGEYLGATAIKTNELIDSALGRVLFIDEAYSLVNEGDGQSDRFGVEAVQTLLKRAEDDRENLIIILAGYEKQTESFLASNPGLASRFATRIRFPTYSPDELLSLARAQLAGQERGAGG